MDRLLPTKQAKALLDAAKDSRELLSNKDRPQRRTDLEIDKSLQQLAASIGWLRINDSNTTELGVDDPNSEPLRAICHGSFYEDLIHKLSSYLQRTTSSHSRYEMAITMPLIDLLQVSPNYEDKNKEINGLLEQLRVRQVDLNKDVKNAISSIEEQSQVHVNRLERESKKSTSDLTIKVKNLESETLQKLESLATDTHVKLEELVSTQKNDLLDFATKNINESIEQKRKTTFEKLDRYGDFLLDEVKSEVNNLSKNVGEEVKKFRSLHEQLSKTLSIVSSDVLADTTIKQAEKEKKTADWLRVFGVIWLGVCIYLYVSGVHFSELVDATGTPQYTLIILRSFLFIAASTPAFYLLRESARHRTDERRYRQKGIQLATIDGYLAEFEESDRNTVKKELTKHYFHGGDHFVDSSSVDNVQGTYDKILDRILASEKEKSKPEA